MADTNFKLDTYTADMLEQLRKIRTALHVGLESFSEIERVTDTYELLESCGHRINERLMPIHPTGSSDTIGVFAGALRALDHIELVVA